MIPTNDRIIVQVNMAQKNTMLIAGVQFSTALKYETNYREKSPVVAQVVDANDRLNKGDFLLCHHNHFYGNSPFALGDDLFSIPANHTIFATIAFDGALQPVYGNILADKIEVPSDFPMPSEYRKFYRDRGKVSHGGETIFAAGDLVFTRPSALYEIVYNWGQEERRVCKINAEMICAVIPTFSAVWKKQKN